jgi:hypothetical protein
MKLNRIDKDHLQEMSKVVNTYHDVVVLGFGKRDGFHESTGCFISYEDMGKGGRLKKPMGIQFMPYRCSMPDGLVPIGRMVDGGDGDEWYWADTDEYSRWKEDMLRELKKTYKK